jgi:sugar lactone lactonase YvrE
MIVFLICAFVFMTSASGFSEGMHSKSRTEKPPVVKVRPAGAKVSTEQSQKYNALMEEGKRLLKEWMDYRAAIEKFNEARAIAQTTPEKSDVLYYLSLAYFASLEQRGEKEFTETVRKLIEVDYYRLPDENECPPQYISMYDSIKRDFGLLKILSNPPGADVYLNENRASAGKTPLSLGMRAGEVKVRVRKNGKQKKDTLTVVAGQSTNSPVYALAGGSKMIYYILGGAALAVGGGAALLLGGGGGDTQQVPAVGSLRVNSSPSGAKIYYGRVGANITDSGHSTPYTFTDLSPGDYTVRLESENHANHEETATVTAGQTTDINATLSKHSINVTQPAAGDTIGLKQNVRIIVKWEIGGGSQTRGRVAVPSVSPQIRNAITNIRRQRARSFSPATARNGQRSSLRLPPGVRARAGSQAVSRSSQNPRLAQQRILSAVAKTLPRAAAQRDLKTADKATTAFLNNIDIILEWGKNFKQSAEIASDIDASEKRYTWNSSDDPEINLETGSYRVRVQSSTDAEVSGVSGTFDIYEPDVTFKLAETLELKHLNLNDPWGIAVDNTAIYLTARGYEFSTGDLTGTHQIVKLDKKAKAIVNKYNMSTTKGEPYQISFDRSGYLYVAEKGHRRVSKYDSNLKPTKDQWKEGPSDSSILPLGVVVDNAGFVYIISFGSQYQWIYKCDKKGNYVKTVARTNGKPIHLAYDSKLDRIYVADRGSDKVKAYDTKGNKIMEWKVPESDSDPVGIVVDSQSYVIVVTQNTDKQKAYVYNKKGDLKGEFGGAWEGGKEDFYHPNAMAIDSQDNVYVLDANPNVMRITKWARK